MAILKEGSVRGAIGLIMIRRVRMRETGAEAEVKVGREKIVIQMGEAVINEIIRSNKIGREMTMIR